MANLKRIKSLFNIDTPSVQECLRVIERSEARCENLTDFRFTEKWLVGETGYSPYTIYNCVNILIDEGLVSVFSRTTRGKKPESGMYSNDNISVETTFVRTRMGQNVYFWEAHLLVEKKGIIEEKSFKIRACSLVEAALRIQQLGHPDKNLLSLRAIEPTLK